MNCLIIDEYPLIVSGLCFVINKYFPGWKTYSEKTVAHGCQYLKKNPVPINVIIVGVNPYVEIQSSTIRNLTHLSADHSANFIIMADDISAVKSHYAGEGVHYFIGKGDSILEILATISEVNAKCGSIKKTPASNYGWSNYFRFTERQRDVVDLVLQGYSNKKIANTLNLSQGTVKNYMFDLMRQVHVDSRLELAMKLREFDYRPKRKIECEPIGQ